MTAALAERTDAPAPPRMVVATPAPVGAAIPAATGPRLLPVPECEPPLDPEPWEHSGARIAQELRPSWPARTGLRGAAAEGARVTAVRAVRTATPPTPPGADAATPPTPPPMAHRRWSPAATPAARPRASHENVRGRAMSSPFSPGSRTTTPGRPGSAAPGTVSTGGPAVPRIRTRATRPVYSATGAVARPDEEYADLKPVIVAPEEPPVTNRPPALDAATLLARALVEVLAGRRPPAQLRPYCTDGVYHALDDFPRLGQRPSLVSVWVCEPTRERAEVAASFRCGDTTRALAMRLDGANCGWQLTALQLA